MLKTIFLTILIMFSVTAVAEGCFTDVLKALVGTYSGVAAIVTFEKGFALQSPKPLAPQSIENESVFRLESSDPCHAFFVKIDYLNPPLDCCNHGPKNCSRSSIRRTLYGSGRSIYPVEARYFTGPFKGH